MPNARTKFDPSKVTPFTAELNLAAITSELVTAADHEQEWIEQAKLMKALPRNLGVPEMGANFRPVQRTVSSDS